MKYFFILLLTPIALFSQNIIDPPPIVTDTTGNFDVIDPVQHKFILGWNWGSPGKKLDDALYMNFYHGYPFTGSSTNINYADSIRISQQLGGDVIGFICFHLS